MSINPESPRGLGFFLIQESEPAFQILELQRTQRREMSFAIRMPSKIEIEKVPCPKTGQAQGVQEHISSVGPQAMQDDNRDIRGGPRPNKPPGQLQFIMREEGDIL